MHNPLIVQFPSSSFRFAFPIAFTSPHMDPDERVFLLDTIMTFLGFDLEVHLSTSYALFIHKAPSTQKAVELLRIL